MKIRKPIICAEGSDDLQSKINIIDFLMWYVKNVKESALIGILFYFIFSFSVYGFWDR